MKTRLERAHERLQSVQNGLHRKRMRCDEAVRLIARLTPQITKLEKSEQRALKRIAEIESEPVPTPTAPPLLPPVDTAIPDFLQRKPLTPVAEQLKVELAERKRIKAHGRIATLKAKQSGALAAMPLSGKDALRKITEG